LKKKIGLGFILLIVLFGILTIFLKTDRNRPTRGKESPPLAETNAIIHTEFGDITLRFFPEDAPEHVKNFIELAQKDFYEKTAFHRIIPGFMIQGGDPNSKSADRSRHGMGGPGYSLKAEFNNNPHKRGTLSMAISADPDSAGSQFFICVSAAPHLDGQYTVFGEVTEGMDVVDKIVSQPRDQNDNPLERIEMTVDILSPHPLSDPQ
jgi:peptidyl-prolyl cis-trans isomerase B (cyclophilin B)